MDIRYIELKTGYNDDGPAWIGNVKESKSGQTVYFNNHAFKKYNCTRGNYVDVETGEFGAYMKVDLLNNGPVTILLEKEFD